MGEGGTREHPASSELYAIADELRGLAAVGLRYATDPNDRERYERALTLAARIVATVENLPASEALETYRGALAHVGPVVGVEAALVHEGQLLLIRRHDDGLWALPGGLAETGETLVEGALRELEEETHVTGSAVGLLGIWDSRLASSRSRHHFQGVMVEVTAVAPRPEPSREATEVRFWPLGELPPAEECSPGHHVRIPTAARILLGRAPRPYLDL